MRDADGDGVHFVSDAHLMPHQPIHNCAMIWLLLGLSFEILCKLTD